MPRILLLITLSLCTLSLVGCEKRINQTKQVIKELPSATQLTKEHVQGQLDDRLEQVNRAIEDPSGTSKPGSNEPDPTKQWVGHKPWKSSTNPAHTAPIKVHTP